MLLLHVQCSLSLVNRTEPAVKSRLPSGLAPAEESPTLVKIPTTCIAEEPAKVLHLPDASAFDKDATLKYFRKFATDFNQFADFPALMHLTSTIMPAYKGKCDCLVVANGGLAEGAMIRSFSDLCPEIHGVGFEIRKDGMHSVDFNLELFKGFPNVHVFHRGMSSMSLRLKAAGSNALATLVSESSRRPSHLKGEEPVETIVPSLFMPKQGISRVEYFSIDCEGHDYEVIHGMHLHTEAKRALFPVFQFELGIQTQLASTEWRQLGDVTKHLASFGYELFLIGGTGGLARQFHVGDEKAKYLWTPAAWYDTGTTNALAHDANILALHPKHALPQISAFVYANAVICVTANEKEPLHGAPSCYLGAT